MLADRGLQLEVGEAAKRHLADAGYEPAYGARPLRRAIQRMIQDPLALRLLEGTFTAGDRVVVDLEDDAMTFRREDAAGTEAAVSR